MSSHASGLRTESRRPKRTFRRFDLRSFHPWGLNPIQQLALATILIVTGLIYLRCLYNGFVSDDYLEIVANRHLGQWSTMWQALFYSAGHFLLGQTCYYRPLKSMWSVLNFHLFKLNSVGWHTLKLLLHLWVTLLTFRVAQLLTNDITAALASAAAFALLPVHTEIVAFVSAIPEPLAAIFELSALCCFIERRSGSWSDYLLPTILFAAALLSFEGAIVFPLLITLYVFLFEVAPQRLALAEMREALAVALRRSAPFFIVLLAYLAIRAAVLGRAEFSGHPVPDPHAVVSPLEAVAMTPSAILVYVTSTVLPWVSGPFHRLQWVGGFGSIRFGSSVLLLALGTFLIALAIVRSSRRALYAFCSVWFVITLLPALNLFATLSRAHLPIIVQDRYLYLPSVGFCVVAGDLTVRFWRSRQSARWVVASTLVAVAITYATFAWRAEGFWHDDEAMLLRAVEVVPDSPLYHRKLALLFEHEGKLSEAYREQRKAVELEPDNRFNRDYLEYLTSRLTPEDR